MGSEFEISASFPSAHLPKSFPTSRPGRTMTKLPTSTMSELPTFLHVEDLVDRPKDSHRDRLIRHRALTRHWRASLPRTNVQSHGKSPRSIPKPYYHPRTGPDRLIVSKMESATRTRSLLRSKNERTSLRSGLARLEPHWMDSSHTNRPLQLRTMPLSQTVRQKPGTVAKSTET